MDRLNIVFTIDSRFVQHFTATVVSLLENNKDLDVNIIVLHDIEDQAELNRVITFVKNKYNVYLHCIYVENALFESYRISLNYSKAVYYRLIITELIPNDIEVVLFLDADTIVNGSLAELAKYEFADEEYLLAVKNISNEDNVKRMNDIGFPIITYFNAGVLLINVKAWRKGKVSAQLIDLANKYMDKIDWWDQDILNIFFSENWKTMDPRYNTLLYADTLPENPVILHYAGREKPWLYVYDPPYKKLYWKYLRLTPYKNATYPDYSFKEFMRKMYIRVMDSLNLRENKNNRGQISLYN
jgi:lipopolysaccharide biosynthesis glycosyltransferase